jgi:hypothetical protein
MPCHYRISPAINRDADELLETLDVPNLTAFNSRHIRFRIPVTCHSILTNTVGVAGSKT